MSAVPHGPKESRHIYSVSRLNREAKDLLEHRFPLLWIEGEISNFSRPASGHWYFSLKDDKAQVRCAMFRNRNYLLPNAPKDGDKVLLRAQISLYEARGEYQLIAEHLEPAGLGALQRAFEELKKKLQAEGLFDPAHKKPLPALPRCIGIITSPTGAAIRDISTTLRRRYPLGLAVLYPVPVQGAEAPAAIIRALQTAGERAECDVLILARGGGSLEDLWAFNDEQLARAIYNCAIPLISAVGHEIDFTIADFVADLRAPTPTAAAELVSPDAVEWTQRLNRLGSQLAQLQGRHNTLLRHKLAGFDQRLAAQHPGRKLGQQMQRLDDIEQRLRRALPTRVLGFVQHLASLRASLRAHSPERRLAAAFQRQGLATQRLQHAGQRLLEARRASLATLARALDALSPLQTLERGYAVATLDGHVLTDATRASIGNSLSLQLRRGRLDAEVTGVYPDQDKPDV
ncbi:MAG: exodeoxyribonuclease VII large subunit [Nevskiales bacterium]